MKTKTTFVITALITLSLLLSACGASEPEATPTLPVEMVQTYAVATFADGLTQTALAAPTNTPTPTSTPTLLPTPTLLTNLTPLGTSAVGSIPVTSCNGLAYVNDVTIPDNTPMTPGQTFTKTWKVSNTGTCAWEAGFKFASTGGDAMGGVPYVLPQSVPPNTIIDISVPMTAPNKTGAVQGNWRMSTAAGQFFGDEVTVVILIGGAASGGAEVPTSTETPVP